MANNYGDLARDLVKQYFPMFVGFSRQITYRSRAADSYNATTGTVTPGANTDYLLSAIFDKRGGSLVNSMDQQSDEQATLAIDRTVMFPAADLPATPKVGDYIIDDQGVYWRVQGISHDPRPALFELHCRPLTET